jgi:membrane protease YdiL (CAAX protease family)
MQMESKIAQQVSGRQVLFTFIIWIVSSIIFGIGTYYALHLWAPVWATIDNVSITIVAGVYLLFLIAAFIIFGGLKGIQDKLNFKFTSTKDLGFGMKWYGITLSASVFLYFILSPFIGSLPDTLLQVLRHASDMSRLSSVDSIGWILIVLRACILAPLTEELLFRGLLFGWLRGRFNATITISITAILFTSIHYYLILFPIGFLFGIISAWVRERTQSSFNFVIAHMVNSTLFLTVAYILVKYFNLR